MISRNLLFVCALLVGCPSREQPIVRARLGAAGGESAGVRRDPSPASVGGSEAEPLGVSRIQNGDGLRGLRSALSDVTRVELLRLNGNAPAEALSTAETERVLKLLREGALTDTHTATSPPWDAVLLFHTRGRGAYAATLVGHSTLRLHPGPARKFEGDAALWNQSPPPEVVLNDEDGWLWQYFESRLGATQQKEYLAPKRAPDYLELPPRP